MTAEPTFTLSFPARAESLTVVRHVLGGIVETWPVHSELLDDVRIAVTEVCASAITRGPAAAGATLEVRGRHDDDRLVIAVSARGPIIDARDGSEDLALSLPLVAALTQRLDIGRTPDGAYQVRMTFPGQADDD